MPESSLIVVIGRIERALARLEHAPPPATVIDNGAQSRHLALRGATEEAIARIDRLLGSDTAG